MSLDLSIPRKVAELLAPERRIMPVQTTVAQFIKTAGKLFEEWQGIDYEEKKSDGDRIFNNSTLVDQVWFRGHADCELSLQPALYRDNTLSEIRKSGPGVSQDWEEDVLPEIMGLEEEMRIDFKSYGHLLNHPGAAISDVDWYFLMQHHGLPTRLLDWTTNSLAALFFSAEGWLNQTKNRRTTKRPTPQHLKDCGAVWMIDAYWLANCMSETWYSPMLPDSTDAELYIPPIQAYIEDQSKSHALIPRHSMPIEPTSIHPRVASQEAKFIIFGSQRELLDEKLVLHPKESRNKTPLRVALIPFRFGEPHAVLETLARMGVSKRTLFPDYGGLSEFLKWKHLHRVSEPQRPVKNSR